MQRSVATFAVLVLCGLFCAVDRTAIDPVRADVGKSVATPGKPAPRKAGAEAKAKKQIAAAPFEPYGVCTHLVWPWLYKDEREVTRALDLIKEAGVQWLRVTVHWEFLEPERGKMNLPMLKRLDFCVEEARRRGLKPYLQILGTPKWNTPQPNDKEFWAYCPVDLNAWEKFVGMIGRRYKGKNQYWEINNEIDWPHFWKSGLPAYADYLKRAARALRAVDAKNVIVLGGLATDGVNAFEYDKTKATANTLEELYKLGAGPDFDIVALHPYSWKDDGIAISIKKIQTAHSVMRAHGDADKRIWCTEIGLSTNHNPPWSDYSEEQQARALRDMYTKLLEHPSVDKVFWYNFRCKGTDRNSQEDNFGIVNNDMTPRKAYTALKSLKKLPQRPGQR